MPVQDSIPWLNYAVKGGDISFLPLRIIKQLRGAEQV